MRKLIKIMLPEVGVEDLKIRPRGDNRCESANRYLYNPFVHNSKDLQLLLVPRRSIKDIKSYHTRGEPG
jgi:hypothetical protein